MAQLLEKTCNAWSADSVRLICTPSALARDTLFYVQEAGHFRTAPPYSTERANLPSYLLLLTLAGRGTLTIGERETALTPGTCLFLNCMDHHRYYTPPGETWEFLWLHFYGSSSAGYYRAFARGGSPTASVENPAALEDLLRQVLSLQRETSQAAELESSQRIVTILTALLRACEGSGGRETWPAYMRAAAGAVERDYAEELTLARLAEGLGVSQYHLSRAFKRWLGENFSDYLCRVRLSRAKALLQGSDLPVHQVADRCGFRDPSYFIRVFRQQEGGVTPLTYRRRWGGP